VLLTDACHSGAITPETDPRALNGAFLDLHSSLFSMTASRDREQSLESPDWGGGHGIFTYYVVRGMEGYADASGDGVVTADELFEYVRANVREATRNRQTPTADRGSFDANMLLAYKRGGAKVASEVASKTGALIFESNMDGVEVFLNGKPVGTVNKSQPLRIPGLPPGAHTVKGVKMGYEPDGPREETVYPGEEKTVTIRILIARRRNRAAVDKFEEGLEFYQKGFAKNYRRAAGLFEQALAADEKYSQAALYLARTYSALYEPEKAFAAFERAISIDPTYYEAKASYAGSLLDAGRTDDSIVQLNDVLRKQPDNAMALYLIAQAYRIKEMYGESINAARKAIRLNPKNPEPHFWLAESLRMSGRHEEAVKEYQEYLRLSDFNSKLAGNLNYYVTGFLIGLGKRKRAAQQDIWQDLRSLAYFGMCDSSRIMKRYDEAIAACRKSLEYDSQDPYTHYVLGNTLMRKANDTGDLELLAEARRRFRTAVDLNENLAEAEMARKNIATIEAFFRQANR
jgi:tetratricopeptide (TPR) repeat protein